MAEMISSCRAPGRYLGAVHLPLQDPQAAADEAERAIKELHLPAVVIGTNVRGKNLDLPEFWPTHPGRTASKRCRRRSPSARPKIRPRCWAAMRRACWGCESNEPPAIDVVYCSIVIGLAAKYLLRGD